MSYDDREWYTVTANVGWQGDGVTCDATITMKVWASSEGVAMVRFRDHMRTMNAASVQEIKATKDLS